MTCANRLPLLSMVLSLFLSGPETPARAVPAFPGAEGYGAVTRGAYANTPTPKIVFVDNLNDTGAGSLRYALQTPVAPRIVVFRVGGTIDLANDIVVTDGSVTICGQTAPGDGICIKGGGIRLKCDDVIMRGLRIRVGTTTQPAPGNADCVGIEGNVSGAGHKRIIIDHCSFSWATDETLTFWNKASDATVQWCISSEGLKNPPAPYTHPETNHGLGILVGDDSTRVSLHHNLMAHHPYRLPLIRENSTTEVVNNVMYNWTSSATLYGSNSAAGSIPLYSDLIRNYYIEGADRATPVSRKAIQFGAATHSGTRFYLQGNIGPFRTSDSQDEWLDSVQNTSPSRPLPAVHRAGSPTATSTFPITMHSTALDAYDAVLAANGAGAITPSRDPVDARVVNTVINRNGHIIDSQSEVGGWPHYASASWVAQDPDNDGMPTSWENAHGTDPYSNAGADGAHADNDGNGYSNLEDYVNSFYAADAGSPVTIEAESCAITTSGPTWQTLNDTAASAGKWVRLNSGAVHDQITFTKVFNGATGVYAVVLKYKKNATFGIGQFNAGGTNLGTPVDQYHTGSWASATLGTYSFTNGTSYAFKLKVTGKNAASAGYYLSVDAIELVP